MRTSAKRSVGTRSEPELGTRAPVLCLVESGSPRLGPASASQASQPGAWSHGAEEPQSPGVAQYATP